MAAPGSMGPSAASPRRRSTPSFIAPARAANRRAADRIPSRAAPPRTSPPSLLSLPSFKTCNRVERNKCVREAEERRTCAHAAGAAGGRTTAPGVTARRRNSPRAAAREVRETDDDIATTTHTRVAGNGLSAPTPVPAADNHNAHAFIPGTDTKRGGVGESLLHRLFSHRANTLGSLGEVSARFGTPRHLLYDHLQASSLVYVSRTHPRLMNNCDWTA